MPSLSPVNTVLPTAPPVVTEPQIKRFKFYIDQSVQDGMTYQNELYRLVKEFTITDYYAAYHCGCDLIGQGVPTVISVSQQHYLVWISLRNPVAASLNTLSPQADS